MAEQKLKRQGMLRFHMREIIGSDELMDILFEEMQEEVIGSESADEVITKFRNKMTGTGVEYMAKRYANDIGATRPATLQA